MTDELYLILHKVRGEPAFDIAQMVEIGKEMGWIIPTSGHRAFPAVSWRLDTLVQDVGYGEQLSISTNAQEAIVDPRFTDLPDHYDVKRDNEPMIDKLRSILKLNKPKKPTYRRYR